MKEGRTQDEGLLIITKLGFMILSNLNRRMTKDDRRANG